MLVIVICIEFQLQFCIFAFKRLLDFQALPFYFQIVHVAFFELDYKRLIWQFFVNKNNSPRNIYYE